MIESFQPLSAQRLTAFMPALQDVRDLPQALWFSSIHPVVNASDAEIIARYIGVAQIADIITDDAQANIYSWGRFQTETNNLPNLKVGMNLTQAQINLLTTLMMQGGAVVAPGSPMANFLGNLAMLGDLGVRQRIESLLIAAYLDDFSYDRFGVKLTGVKWGTPAQLKATPSTPWTTAGSATPVSDILNMQQIGLQQFGRMYDRAIMSTSAFQYLINTTDFINRARVAYSINPTISATTLSLDNIQSWIDRAIPILGLRQIKLYDARYRTQDTTGAVTSVRFLPANKVILSSIDNDNMPQVLDFANAVVTESIVANLVPTQMVGMLPPGTYGPVSYATPTNVNLNPPGITVWAAARGWTRKWDQAMNAVLTVGSFSDTISTAVPFPVS